MSIVSKLTQIKAAVNQAAGTSTGVSVFHFTADQKVKDRYIVWQQESGSGSLQSDNKLNEQKISGTVDYFTKQEYDTIPDALQEAFDDNGIAYYLNSVQYEDETKLTHWEWVIEV